MGNKPKWYVDLEREGTSEIDERKKRTENFYSLKILIKIAEKYKHEDLPSSDYYLDRGNLSSSKNRQKYLSKLITDGWIEWQESSDNNKKHSGWIPTAKGFQVIKLLRTLQDQSNPILSLEAFRDLGYIHKSLTE